MARVNHKLVKQRLNEKRSKITDRQFFTSRLFAGHLEDLAAAQTRRYHYNRRVRVNIYWNSKDSFFAATDNMSVKINAGHPFITKTKGRENRYQIILGVFAHELGHILYTDFLAGQTHHNYLGAHKWYPYPPVLATSADARRENAFWEYVKEDPKNLEMAQYIAGYISNVIDDGYVENRMLANFPGKLGYGLEELRQVHFEDIPTVTQLIEKEDTEGRHIFESIAQIMLSYAKYGEIKYGEEPLSEERIQVVFSLINDIDTALMSRSGKERLVVINTIIVRCWDYLEDFCEECKKRQEEAEAAGGTSSIAQTLSEVLQSIAGGSAVGTGSSSKVRANQIRLPQQKQGRKPTKMLKKAKTVTVLAPDPKVRKKMLLPRLTQKLMKIHLSLVEAAKENLPAHLWVKEKQCRAVAPEVANSRCPVAKKVEFLCARRQVFPILPVEPLNMTMIISERCTTVLPLISSVYWKRWRKKLLVSSWRMSVFENSTMLPKIFPTGTCMRVYR